MLPVSLAWVGSLSYGERPCKNLHICNINSAVLPERFETTGAVEICQLFVSVVLRDLNRFSSVVLLWQIDGRTVKYQTMILKSLVRYFQIQSYLGF